MREAQAMMLLLQMLAKEAKEYQVKLRVLQSFMEVEAEVV